MTSGGRTGESATRLAVVDLRLRLERVATRAVTAAFSSHAVVVEQTRIRERLAFIPVAYEAKAPLPELLGMVRLARHIYGRTSDVLHGRSNMVNLSTVLLAEWESFVVQLEALERPVAQNADSQSNQLFDSHSRYSGSTHSLRQ